MTDVIGRKAPTPGDYLSVPYEQCCGVDVAGFAPCLRPKHHEGSHYEANGFSFEVPVDLPVPYSLVESVPARDLRIGDVVFVAHFMGDSTHKGTRGFWAKVLHPAGQHQDPYRPNHFVLVDEPRKASSTPFFHWFDAGDLVSRLF